ncbi:MAG: cysteine desulfurase [Patescibacteria group bacterium]|nr:cysteine desulfurase [Patescibacteria group bacterium]
MNIEKTRKDFPFLKSNKNIYFDNACNTLRPVSVIEKMNEYYTDYPVCAGRSNFSLAEKLTNDISDVRKEVAKFIRAKKSSEIIFTRNTTESINLLAKSFKFRKGDVILTSDKEHNSNLIPWQYLAKEKGLIHKVIPSNQDNTFNLDRFKEMLTPEVKLVAIGMTSNLDGVSVPAKDIINIAHKNGSLVLLDGAQTVAHEQINVSDLDADFLAFSGHKIFGPSGIGVLYGKMDLLESLNPFLLGGSTVSNSTYDDFELMPIPKRFEAGLQNFPGILGLGEAIKYIRQVGFKNIAKQELLLNTYLTTELSKIDGLKIIGPIDPSKRSGIISFYSDGLDVHQLSIMLDRSAGIMLRSGQHCVHSWFNSRGIENSLRISLSFYNTIEEAQKFILEFNKILKILK